MRIRSSIGRGVESNAGSTGALAYGTPIVVKRLSAGQTIVPIQGTDQHASRTLCRSPATPPRAPEVPGIGQPSTSRCISASLRTVDRQLVKNRDADVTRHLILAFPENGWITREDHRDLCDLCPKLCPQPACPGPIAPPASRPPRESPSASPRLTEGLRSACLLDRPIR
jgi:hypothetical protein